MSDEVYTYEVRTRADGDGRRYPGKGNRHERRRASAELRRSGQSAPMKVERFTFRLSGRGAGATSDVYVPQDIKVEL